MLTLNTTPTIYSQTKAAEIAAAMNADEDDTWEYVVVNNPNLDGPKTALIKVYEDGEYIATL